MAAGILKIKITDSKGTQVLSVSKSTVTVGRASHCDIVLEHPSVQPEHVRAWLEGGRIWVQDLGTSVGTAMNGIRLPSLKPMLMRDLDVIKLGEFPASLGFEANLVRPPVVKTESAAEEITATDFRLIIAQEPNSEAAEKRIEELSREVADLKFKLQTSKLDANSADELRRQIRVSQDELKAANDQKEKLADVVSSLEHEKQTLKLNLENEIAEFKLKALRDLKVQKDSDHGKFEGWKAEAALELGRQLRVQTQAKVKAWSHRPVTPELILEWESELTRMMRWVLLNEESLPSQTSAQNEVAGTTPPKLSHGAASSSPIGAIRSIPRDRLLRYILMSAGSVCVLGIFAWSFTFLRRQEAPRSVASAPSQSLESTSKAVPAQPQKELPQPVLAAQMSPPAPAKVTPPGADKKPRLYAPKQSRIYKKTYTENMMFTLNFEQAELNNDYRRKWIDELNLAARIWKLDARTVGALVNKEMEFLLDLRRLKTGVTSDREKETLAKMYKRESLFLRDMESLLKNKQNVDKFLNLKQGFFARNYQFVVRR